MKVVLIRGQYSKVVFKLPTDEGQQSKAYDSTAQPTQLAEMKVQSQNHRVDGTQEHTVMLKVKVLHWIEIVV